MYSIANDCCSSSLHLILSLLVFYVLLSFGCSDPLSSWASLKFCFVQQRKEDAGVEEKEEGLSVFPCSFDLRTALNSSCLSVSSGIKTSG